MVRSRVLRDAEFGAKERGADFGDQLFGCIRGISEALAEFTIQTMFRSSPVRQLVNEGGIIAFAARHALSAAEQSFIRHLDAVSGRAIESPLTSVLDFRGGSDHETIRCSDAINRAERLR